MQPYQEKQRELFDSLEEGFRKNEIQTTIVESVDDFANDNRMSLTAVGFLSKELQETIQSKIITPLREADSRQYFFEPDALHLTIQNVRTSHTPALFNDTDIKKAQNVFRQILPRSPRQSFMLRGLFELPTSVSIRGYIGADYGTLVRSLRQSLSEASVPDNKVYASDDVVFGNVTVCRFTTEPNKAFRIVASQLKEMEIGIFDIHSVSLITTNTVCLPQKTRVIEEFILQK